MKINTTNVCRCGGRKKERRGTEGDDRKTENESEDKHTARVEKNRCTQRQGEQRQRTPERNKGREKHTKNCHLAVELVDNSSFSKKEAVSF